MSFRFELMKRALSHTMYHLTDQKAPITPDMLRELCQLTRLLGPIGALFKCVFTLAFFSFLRCSNLSGSQFDSTRQLCRGDVISLAGCLAVLIKWSKTLQQRDKPQCIVIAAMPDPEVCPVQALSDFTSLFPANNNAPLFSYQVNGRQIILSASKIRDVLKTLLDLLGYDSSQFSMHSFRRGGCTTAHLYDTDPMRIKQHGLWSSNAFERYICPGLQDKLLVTQNMSLAFNGP